MSLDPNSPPVEKVSSDSNPSLENKNVPLSESTSYKPGQPKPPSSIPPSNSPPVTQTISSIQQTNINKPDVSYAENAVKIDPNGLSKKNVFKIVFSIVFIFLTVFTIIGGLVYAIAYEKIKIKNDVIALYIRKFALGLPFTPKPPEYLLQASVLAHSQVSSQSFSMSLAAESNQLSSSLGLNKIDMEVKGDVDFNDLKNILMDIEVSITKDFNVLLRQKGDMLYFKVNKLPPTIMSFLDPANKIMPLLDNWISYDTSTLETEARKYLDETKQQEDEQITDNVTDFFDDKILNAITSQRENLEGQKTFKISLNADAQMIDYIAKKLEAKLQPQNSPAFYDLQSQNQTKASDIIKNLKLNIWIEDKTFYTRKVLISFEIKPDTKSLSDLTPGLIPPLSSEPETTAVVIAMTFSNFGKTFDVETPKNTVKFEEFLKELQTVLFSDYAKSANEATLKSDLYSLAQSLEMYYIDNSECPADLKSLVPEYISRIPEFQEGYSIEYSTGFNRVTCQICSVIGDNKQECLTIPHSY